MNPDGSAFNPATIRSVVEKSVGLLERRCIRLNGRDPNWRGLFDDRLPEVLQASSPAEFESRMNAVITRGGLSHIAFFHQSAQRAPARYAINATFCQFDTPGGQRWLFQDVHDGGPANAAGIRPGDLLLRVNGQSTAPPELPTFALGTDAQVAIESADGAARDVTVVLPKADPRKRNAKPRMAEPTSVTARPIESGVGYVRIAFFPGVNGQRFARELDRALNTLHDCSRLIIDLRGNLGGFVGSLRLMSYLTADRDLSATALREEARTESGGQTSWPVLTDSRQPESTLSRWPFGSWSFIATGQSGSQPRAWDRNRSTGVS
jgi:hypothetical protein